MKRSHVHVSVHDLQQSSELAAHLPPWSAKGIQIFDVARMRFVVALAALIGVLCLGIAARVLTFMPSM